MLLQEVNTTHTNCTIRRNVQRDKLHDEIHRKFGSILMCCSIRGINWNADMEVDRFEVVILFLWFSIRYPSFPTKIYNTEVDPTSTE